MRDIGRRIQRYRLSRYGTPGGLGRPPRWVWLALILWLAWVGFVSDHSLYRIWRMGAENTRAQRELREARREIERLDRDARDPKMHLRNAERALRKEGFARPGEIIYRIDGDQPDSLAR